MKIKNLKKWKKILSKQKKTHKIITAYEGQIW